MKWEFAAEHESESEEAPVLVDESEYRDAVQALSEYVQHVLFGEAIEILRNFEQEIVLNIEDFPNDLQNWSFAGDAKAENATSIMFDAFKEWNDAFSLRRHLERVLERAADIHIDRLDFRKRALVLEACNFDQDLRPLGLLDREKRDAARSSLLEQLGEILTNYDSDILLD